MPARITSTYRYKRPQQKGEAALAGPAIVRRGTAKPETPPALTGGRQQPAGAADRGGRGMNSPDGVTTQ